MMSEVCDMKALQKAEAGQECQTAGQKHRGRGILTVMDCVWLSFGYETKTLQTGQGNGRKNTEEVTRLTEASKNLVKY